MDAETTLVVRLFHELVFLDDADHDVGQAVTLTWIPSVPLYSPGIGNHCWIQPQNLAVTKSFQVLAQHHNKPRLLSTESECPCSATGFLYSSHSMPCQRAVICKYMYCTADAARNTRHIWNVHAAERGLIPQQSLLEKPVLNVVH
jgi:hypothetical protein